MTPPGLRRVGESLEKLSKSFIGCMQTIKLHIARQAHTIAHEKHLENLGTAHKLMAVQFCYK